MGYLAEGLTKRLTGIGPSLFAFTRQAVPQNSRGVTPFALLGRGRAAVPHFNSVDPSLHALLRKRVEIYTWLDSPAKQAYLAKINRMIEQHRDREARGEPRRYTLGRSAL
jgi:hypothetical protein